jgi:hypothetical protein
LECFNVEENGNEIVEQTILLSNPEAVSHETEKSTLYSQLINLLDN